MHTFHFDIVSRGNNMLYVQNKSLKKKKEEKKIVIVEKEMASI